MSKFPKTRNKDDKKVDFLWVQFFLKLEVLCSDIFIKYILRIEGLPIATP